MTRRPVTLILRKTKVQALISGWNPDIWSEDEYCVLDGDCVVGRLYPEAIHRKARWL